MSCCGPVETIVHAAHGAAGLAKAALRIDRPPASQIQARRDECRVCPHSSRNPAFPNFNGLTTFSKCALCGCFIAAKTVLESEKCPEGKW